VNTYTTPMLLSTVESKRLEPKKLVTHRFTLDRIIDAYATFSDAAHSRALKVVISNQGG
jgi:alcohol dehydrogenase